MKKIDLFTINKWFFSKVRLNPKIKHYHVALFFWISEKANQNFWADSFYFPTEEGMNSSGFFNWKTYNKTLIELEDFGFIKILEKSKNQYTPCVIAPRFYQYIAATSKQDPDAPKSNEFQGKISSKSEQNHIQITTQSLKLINTYIHETNNTEILPEYLIDYFQNQQFEFLVSLYAVDSEVRELIDGAITIINQQ